MATSRHAELYLTWCVSLLSMISKSTVLKRKAKSVARLAARSVRAHRGNFNLNFWYYKNELFFNFPNKKLGKILFRENVEFKLLKCIAHFVHETAASNEEKLKEGRRSRNGRGNRKQRGKRVECRGAQFYGGLIKTTCTNDDFF